MIRLVPRYLFKHPIRTFLTVGALTVAFLLLCILGAIVQTLDAGVKTADARRLIVQSAVSLFVDLPLSYTAKIEGVEGVQETCRWQWFGGFYQEQSNFFAQFAVDGAEMLEMYPEANIIEGSREAFLGQRNACLIGEGLAERFGWSVGEKVPIIGALFPRPEPYEFEVAAIYEALKPNFDDNTLFFNWDYFEESQKELNNGDSPGVGVIVLILDEGAQAEPVMAAVDGLFENGPQRVQTTTEAEFNRQFVSMVGSLPRFLMLIGGGIFAAVLLACVNTMLMASREQTHDVGVLKALGFSDGSTGFVMLAQSFAVALLGGGLGILLAKAFEPWLSKSLATTFPAFEIPKEVVGLALVLIVLVAIVAGIVPSLKARGMRPVEALRAD